METQALSGLTPLFISLALMFSLFASLDSGRTHTKQNKQCWTASESVGRKVNDKIGNEKQINSAQ